MARKNNYFRRQPETKVIPIRETEFKIKSVELIGTEKIKIITENGTKYILFFANYKSYEWEVLQDYLSEKDSVVIRHRASKIVEGYVTVTKKYHILKDIQYDENQVGYYFFFEDEKGELIEVFLPLDDYWVRESLCWDYEELKEDPKIENLKIEFIGEKAVLVYIGKRPVKIDCFLNKQH